MAGRKVRMAYCGCWNVNKAIVWIASGKQYINEAIQSATSARDHSDLPRILCTDGPNTPDIFDDIIRLPERRYKFWYLDSVYYLNVAAEKAYQQGIEEILLLDTDTLVCGDLVDYFRLLERFDIVGTQAIGRETAPSLFELPVSFPELHIGVLCFRRSSTLRLFEEWLEFYQENTRFYGNNDQGPLRDALWRCIWVKVGIMPAEFCFRFRWGGLISGPVRVLHGREHAVPLADIAEEVNSQNGIRVYQRRELA